MHGTRSQHDLAYGCFLLCGLTALVIRVMSVIPMDTGTAGGLGILVAVPLTLASFTAMVVGVSLTVRLWRDGSLVALSVMSLLFAVQFFMQYGPTAFYNAVPVVYGVAVVAICGRWFVVRRKQRFPPP